jgi:peptidoglycan/LPS O-acetylase OafA/YrhL
LITGILTHNHEVGHINLINFYLGRFRRLAPAYFVTLAVTSIFSYLLVPEYLINFAAALRWSSVFLSNIYFIGQTDYFAPKAEYQPLLHTWSLAVEWQFYLIWPTLLVLALKYLRRSTLMLFLLIGILATVLASQFFKDSASSFYFTPFRLFEFFIGASAFFLKNTLHVNAFDDYKISALGLVGFAISILWLGQLEHNPSVLTLVPCLSCAALLVFRCRLVSEFLEWQPLVWIGKCSYSLYLIHWPVILFARYVTFNDLTSIQLLLLIAFCIGLSSLSLIYIEQPFRNSVRKRSIISDRLLVTLTLLSSLGFAIIGIVLTFDKGWAIRFDADRLTRSSTAVEQAKIELKRELAGAGQEDFSNNGQLHILIVGDSHAADLHKALDATRGDAPNIEFRWLTWRPGCYGKLRGSIASRLMGSLVGKQYFSACERELQSLRNSILVKAADIIILANAWNLETTERTPQAVSVIREMSSAKIILLGLMRLPFDPSILYLVIKNVSDLNLKMYSIDNGPNYKINSLLQQQAYLLGLEYVDIMKYVCVKQKRQCLVTNEDGDLLFLDDNHWSQMGRSFYGPPLLLELRSYFVQQP